MSTLIAYISATKTLVCSSVVVQSDVDEKRGLSMTHKVFPFNFLLNAFLERPLVALSCDSYTSQRDLVFKEHYSLS